MLFSHSLLEIFISKGIEGVIKIGKIIRARALDWQSRGRGFDPHQLHIDHTLVALHMGVLIFTDGIHFHTVIWYCYMEDEQQGIKGGSFLNCNDKIHNLCRHFRI